MLDAASSGQRFATPESEEMKDKCSCRVNAGIQCGLFHARRFIPGCKGEGVRLSPLYYYHSEL